tara:strand:- start:1617 stop:1772 length:156 start_codon:yes stop_codon:yes gene_type:complete
MNKFDRYIDWCVNELMDNSTIDHSKELVRMDFDGGNIGFYPYQRLKRICQN